MTTIKQGDAIRRVGPTTSYSGVTILHNHVYLAGRVIEGSVMIEGFPFSINRFEKVEKAVPVLTDEAVAASFRVAYEQMSVARNALIERGYTIQFEGFHGTPFKASTLGKKFTINKTITTVKDI